MAAITTRGIDSFSGTGTITTSSSSTSVTGSGTSFTTEILVGNVLKKTDGTSIGTVASVANNTTLALAANAAVTLAGQSYNISLTTATIKGSPLTNDEVDINFLKHNNLKLERTNNLSDLSSKSSAIANLSLTIGTNTQAWSTDLDAISSLTTFGLITRTAAGTSSTRALTGVTNEVVINNADGVAGNIGVSLGSNIPRLNAATNVFSGDITAVNLNATSDRSMKYEISPIPNALETVRRLEGTSFHWLSNNKKSFGVIAQQLELVLPELVDEQNGIKSVNYLGLIAFLINAVKELDQEVQALKVK
jgi:hypothetical protein